MGLSSRFRKQAEEVSAKRAQLAYERSKVISEDIIKSSQFQLALSAGNLNMEQAVDKILQNACKSIFDPVADFLDTMRSKGLPEPYIRQYVHRLYVYIHGTDKEGALYEDMLKDVAAYMMEHPEMYMTVQDTSGEELISGMNENL